MATAIEDFPQWLNEKLQKLNTDETVFGSYIQGILDSDETTEEKTEALLGILSEFVENEDEIMKICNEILEKWQLSKPTEPVNNQMSSEDVNIKLAKLMESQSLPTTKQREYTEEQRKIRDAILSQYSQTPVDENDCEEGNQDTEDMEKNLNAQTVANAEKNKREQARMDSQKKKEKDKEDREKQKQLKEEKKEKRKTVKGERRR